MVGSGLVSIALPSVTDIVYAGKILLCAVRNTSSFGEQL